jgi:5-methylcytosine-specific restriction endonuclease McrA
MCHQGSIDKTQQIGILRLMLCQNSANTQPCLDASKASESQIPPGGTESLEADQGKQLSLIVVPVKSEYACNKCFAVRPASEFRIHAYGHRIKICRECEAMRQRKWYLEHEQQAKKWNRDYMAARRSISPELANEKYREWRLANRKRIREEARIAYSKRFFAARLVGLRREGHPTIKDLAKLWKSQRGICALTGRNLDRKSQIDHIVPVSRGGSDRIENLRWVVKEANRSKLNLLDHEFIELCKDVISWSEHQPKTV